MTQFNLFRTGTFIYIYIARWQLLRHLLWWCKKVSVNPDDDSRRIKHVAMLDMAYRCRQSSAKVSSPTPSVCGYGRGGTADDKRCMKRKCEDSRTIKQNVMHLFYSSFVAAYTVVGSRCGLRLGWSMWTFCAGKVFVVGYNSSKTMRVRHRVVFRFFWIYCTILSGFLSMHYYWHHRVSRFSHKTWTNTLLWTIKLFAWEGYISLWRIGKMLLR